MLNILFVCYGNTCRSPMAEGLARRLLGEQVYVESAGLSPHSQRATPAAVELLRERYEIDISAHRPRQVDDLPLDSFDWIVALDPEIHAALSARYPRLAARLIGWQVDDPYGLDATYYARTAATIEGEIRALAGRLGLTLSKE